MKSLRNALGELGLSDLPLFIRWFKPAYDHAREKFLSGVKDYFSNRNDGILRGRVLWNIVLTTGAVMLNVDTDPTTSRTLAHELKHIEQCRRLCCEQPTGSLLNELEREAETYADNTYQRVRVRRYPHAYAASE
jgi:hypothetical protein